MALGFVSTIQLLFIIVSKNILQVVFYLTYFHHYNLYISPKKKDIDDEKFEIYFGGLYSVYSLANIFLPFIGGRLRDNLGDRLVLVIMCLLITFG